jgi:hypothetical protein
MKAVKSAERVKEWAVYSILSAFGTLLLWWQISPQMYREFDGICKNYGYNDCMRWYWENLKFFQAATGVFAVGFVVSVVVLGYLVVRFLQNRGE